MQTTLPGPPSSNIYYSIIIIIIIFPLLAAYYSTRAQFSSTSWRKFEITQAIYLFLSWARLIQSTSSQKYFLKIHFNIILQSRLDLPSSVSPSGYPAKTWHAFNFSLTRVACTKTFNLDPIDNTVAYIHTYIHTSEKYCDKSDTGKRWTRVAKRMECLNQRGSNKIILPSNRRPEIKKTANGYKTLNVSYRARNIKIVLP